MRGGNPFTLHVHCIGGLEIKSPLLSGASEERGMMSHRERRETLLESNRGWQWKRKWAAGPRVGTEAEEHLRICKKAPFESCPSLLCRETLATSHWVPPSQSSSCAPLPSTPLLTTLICYDRRGHHQHLRFQGDFAFPAQQVRGWSRATWGM